jgi:tRNA-splicing ligase RtcB
MESVLRDGARWAVRQSYGDTDDLDVTEENGAMASSPDEVGERPRERGTTQLGTLGAGNHFLEVQVVEEVFDEAAASAMKIAVGMVTVLIHSGSRGLGHQVCQDFLRGMDPAARRYGISLPEASHCPTVSSQACRSAPPRARRTLAP